MVGGVDGGMLDENCGESLVMAVVENCGGWVGRGGSKGQE